MLSAGTSLATTYLYQYSVHFSQPKLFFLCQIMLSNCYHFQAYLPTYSCFLTISKLFHTKYYMPCFVFPLYVALTLTSDFYKNILSTFIIKYYVMDIADNQEK